MGRKQKGEKKEGATVWCRGAFDGGGMVAMSDDDDWCMEVARKTKNRRLESCRQDEGCRVVVWSIPAGGRDTEERQAEGGGKEKKTGKEKEKCGRKEDGVQWRRSTMAG